MAEYKAEDQSSYLRVKNHLDEIAQQVKAKDLPLERALDLYEEAIRLGNSCADLIDTTDFSLEEIENFNEKSEKDGSDEGEYKSDEGEDKSDEGEDKSDKQSDTQESSDSQEASAAQVLSNSQESSDSDDSENPSDSDEPNSSGEIEEIEETEESEEESDIKAD